MGPVWRLMRGEKDLCHRCGRETTDSPAVGTVVDYKFHPEQRYCWECYAVIRPFVDEVASEKLDPYRPVTRPAIV
jgi:hypothetical protein